MQHKGNQRSRKYSHSIKATSSRVQCSTFAAVRCGRCVMEKHRLADLFSSLRRTTPRVPFFRLAAHRVPTLWTLYRGLLKNAPGDDVCTISLREDHKLGS